MNRILCFVVSIVVIVNLVACSNSPNSAAIKSPVYPKSISFDDNDSKLAVMEKIRWMKVI